jgi:hypothetical protein
MSDATLSLFSFLLLILSVETGCFVCRIGGERVTSSTRDTVKQTTGIIASLTALVLGLLIANGQGSLERQSASISSLVAGITSLDETLRHFGSDADAVRADLRASVEPILLLLWEPKGEAGLDLVSRTRNESFILGILALSPDGPEQQTLKDNALLLANELTHERFRLATLEHAALPIALIVTLLIWSAVLFVGLGLSASQDWYSRTALYGAAGAAATAIFLVAEYASPFSGFIQISRRPIEVLTAALSVS